jgi:hypothetical protein
MVAIVERMMSRFSAGFHRPARRSEVTQGRPPALSREDRRAIGRRIVEESGPALSMLEAYDRGIDPAQRGR